MKCIIKMHFFHISYQVSLIIKILLDSQMYVVIGVEFIFSISLLIWSVKIRNWKMSLLISPVFPTLKRYADEVNVYS